jgi:hypothetical protein
MIYGQILNNIVLNIIELDDSTLIPLFTEGYDYCIEIDALSTIPNIGWYYDISSTTFYPPLVLALIQDNIVVNIIHNCEIYITNNSSNYQYIIDVTSANPQPMIGWSYNGTIFIPTQAYYQAVVGAAIAFGNQMIVQAAAQNVSLGITQAGQTLAMMNYCSILITCLSTGSLYQAITQLGIMIADTSSAKTSLSPFITNDILYSCMNQIQGYLGLPLTPNPGP